MSKTNNKKLLIIIFLAVLILPQAVWPAVKGLDVFAVSEGENRTLNEFPDLTATAVSDIPGGIEDWYEDALAFRDPLIYANSRINYDVFKSSVTDQVVVGKDGWLFLGESEDGTPLDIYRGADRFTIEEMEEIKAKLILMRDKLLEKGTRFAFVIAPDKSRIYPEYLPDAIPKSPDTDRTLELIEYLREDSGLHIVWPCEELMEAKSVHPDTPIYYPLDTHWNPLGGYVGTLALSKEMDMGLPDYEDVEVEDSDRETTDLANLLHLGGYLKTGRGPAVAGYGEEDLNTLRFETDDTFEFENWNEDAEGSLFAVRDSYMDYMFLFMASRYKHSKMIHHKVFDMETVYDGTWSLAGQYDIFVLEMAERRLGELIDTN